MDERDIIKFRRGKSRASYWPAWRSCVPLCGDPYGCGANMTPDCMACLLTAGERELPGGRIFQTQHWVVEHCVGTLGLGALILKPFRHIVGLADMSSAEAAALGPLLQRTASVIKTLTDADQIYTCLWSHADWRPGHIHFVLQPAWNALRSRYPRARPRSANGHVYRGDAA